MSPNRQEETQTTSDESQRLERLELLEILAEHPGIGAILLGSDAAVQLQTRQIDRFETILMTSRSTPREMFGVPSLRVGGMSWRG
jgi:hypothetical protein